MRFLIILTVVILIGCGGSNPTIPPDHQPYGFALNESGDLIVYEGDYGYILSKRCEECHSIEHRPNP